MTFWFDFTNPPHVNFYLPLLKHFSIKEIKTILTARDFVETKKLLEIHNLPFALIGKHGGKNKLSKILQLINRNITLFQKIDSFDVSFSSNYDAPLVSWLKGKPSFVFDDNDISPNWLYSKFANYVISPEAIDKVAMYKMGIKEKQLITYDGYKEDIYIADYKPDPVFLSNLPFADFVTVRPENMKASYVSTDSKSIVPELIDKLVKKGFNVLFLPRYESDRQLIKSSSQIFIPNRPLNGLDVCFYSTAVLTGAGTFSREAGVMGVPAVSFFAGNKFLGVDKKMFKEKTVFFSRQVDEIISYVVNSSRKPFAINKSKEIQQEFFSIVNNLIDKTINK